MKLNYVKPELINLDLLNSNGLCESGSSVTYSSCKVGEYATNKCDTGTQADAQCNSVGTTAGTVCNTGTLAQQGDICTNGSSYS